MDIAANLSDCRQIAHCAGAWGVGKPCLRELSCSSSYTIQSCVFLRPRSSSRTTTARARPALTSETPCAFPATSAHRRTRIHRLFHLDLYRIQSDCSTLQDVRGLSVEAILGGEHASVVLEQSGGKCVCGGGTAWHRIGRGGRADVRQPRQVSRLPGLPPSMPTLFRRVVTCSDRQSGG